MNKIYVVFSAAVVLTVAFAAYGFAKPQTQSNSENLPSPQDQLTAVTIVRAINTAEVSYLYGYGKGPEASQPRHRYATWPDLYASGLLEGLKSAPGIWSLVNADGVQGYKLALIVSSDGQSYELALHDAKPENALFSVFSDQSGLIYTGEPLQ